MTFPDLDAVELQGHMVDLWLVVGHVDVENYEMYAQEKFVVAEDSARSAMAFEEDSAKASRGQAVVRLE